MTKPSEVLQSIADVLLGCPERLCKNVLAKTINGCPVMPTNDDAFQFCSVGFVDAACFDFNVEMRHAVLSYLYSSKRISNIGKLVSWNNAPERTAAEVQAEFQKAADLARKEGQ